MKLCLYSSPPRESHADDAPFPPVPCGSASIAPGRSSWTDPVWPRGPISFYGGIVPLATVVASAFPPWFGNRCFWRSLHFWTECRCASADLSGLLFSPSFHLLRDFCRLLLSQLASVASPVRSDSSAPSHNTHQSEFFPLPPTSWRST